MKHNKNNQRTKRIIKGIVGGLLLLNLMAAASPAAADGPTTTTTTIVTLGPINGGVSTNVSWGGCGGNCGQ